MNMKKKEELVAKRVKPEKYEALEFTDQVSIESFQVSEGWLEKWKKRCVTNFLYR